MSTHCNEVLVTWMGLCMAAAGVLNTLGKEMAYGRFWDREGRPRVMLPARLAWCTQEMPSLAVPVILLLVHVGSSERGSVDTVNIVHLAMFCGHYFQRLHHLPGWRGYEHSQRLDPSKSAETWGVCVQNPTCASSSCPCAAVAAGGLFELVSGANFLGEIVEWIGYALATWTFPAFAFAIFTIGCIGPRALHHHRWGVPIRRTSWHGSPGNDRGVEPSHTLNKSTPKFSRLLQSWSINGASGLPTRFPQ
ncbi:3-oxo-5-alpha-steroid 4-dehydrogenase 2-like isoform X4 [Petromyzon marinus]|uniref:3-oxo-5-alpha-steroid 4-dehydrogenase 2-like isoform X4 n=1 Tax=Petromyzon marinus TaxID=7757 RepID=UPI003F6FA73E